jgi:hypothetical protein
LAVVNWYCKPLQFSIVAKKKMWSCKNKNLQL